MQYGLYLSAAGVQVASHKQDVIANNIANAETVGFKRDLALFQERKTEREERGLSPSRSNKMLEMLGGGTFVAPTQMDWSQGELEPTGNKLDVAIVGKGYFSVKHGDETKLTRAGRFVVNHNSRLALGSNENVELMDVKGKPITIGRDGPVEIARDGTVSQKSKVLGQIGVFDVADQRQLKKIGGSMIALADPKSMKRIEGSMRNEFVERANVEASSELANLMEAQRQLEANANMIRYQDQMLSKLVNEVGKIS